jgi:peroxiredoxin
MKYRLIFVQIILLISISTYSQSNSFSIYGNINGVKNGYAQIWQPKSDSTFYIDENKFIISNGKFKIEGHLAFPHKTALVIFDNDDNVFEADWFYIDRGNHELDISIINDQIKLTSSSKTFNEHYNFFKPKMDSLNLICREIKKSIINFEKKAINQELLDSLNRLNEIALVQRSIFVLEYIIENPKSYVGLEELSSSISRYRNVPIYEIAFYFLDEELKQNYIGHQILEKIKYSKILVEGAIFPSLKLLNTKNEEVSLTQENRNKITLIDFWFHSCGFCIEQFPDLKKIYAKHHTKGFQIIGITIDKARNEDDWKKTIEKYKLPWLQLWDLNGVNCRKYFISQFPTNYLLNEKGEILQKNIDLEKLNDFLDKNL